MDINKDTRAADILREYGDIAEIVATFGAKRVGALLCAGSGRTGADGGVGGSHPSGSPGRIPGDSAPAKLVLHRR